MPEANETLEESSEYPLCFLLTGIGAMIVLTVEQVTIALSHGAKEHRKSVALTNESVHTPLNGHDHGHSHE